MPASGRKLPSTPLEGDMGRTNTGLSAFLSFLSRNRYILTTALLASLTAAAMAIVCVLFPPTLLMYGLWILAATPGLAALGATGAAAAAVTIFSAAAFAGVFVLSGIAALVTRCFQKGIGDGSTSEPGFTAAPLNGEGGSTSPAGVGFDATQEPATSPLLQAGSRNSDILPAGTLGAGDAVISTDAAAAATATIRPLPTLPLERTTNPEEAADDDTALLGSHGSSRRRSPVRAVSAARAMAATGIHAAASDRVSPPAVPVDSTIAVVVDAAATEAAATGIATSPSGR